MRILAFTGMPGAGKSEAVEEARRRGLPIVSMGDEVRATVRGLGLPLTDDNVGRVATDYRREKGPDWWARRTVERLEIQYPRQPLVVIDGVRTRSEIEFFRTRLGPTFHLVAIEAPLEVRADRLRRRARADDGLTIDDVRRRDQREIGWGIRDAIDSADTVIRNLGDLPQFQGEIRGLFERLTRAA